MKKIFLYLLVLYLISCGGSSSSNPSSNSASEITGMQGDISAIEPIDLD